LFLPLVGSVAYLVAEVLPEFLGQGAVRRAGSAARGMLDPERRLRALEEAAQSLDTPQAYASLAKELARLRRYPEALAAYDRAMTGLFAGDPELGFAVAETAFEAAEAGVLPWDRARAAMEALDTAEEKFRAKDRILLRARLAAADGDAVAAEAGYRELTRGHAPFEVRVRYAHFLYTQNRLDEAQALLAQVMADAKRSTPHVRQMNAEWIAQAETALTVVVAAQAKA
jgi:hypothetical protein